MDIDQDVYAQLLQTGQFDRMRLDTDEVLVGCRILTCAAFCNSVQGHRLVKPDA